MHRLLTLLFALLVSSPAIFAAPPPLEVEANPTDASLHKIVVIVGSNYYKPGEHDYVAAAKVFRDLLQQTPKVAVVIALDWPKKPETLTSAKTVVFLFDGAEKHQFLQKNRLADLQKLAESRVGLVFFHQTLDISKDLGDRFRNLSGAAWEKGLSQRGHWVSEFTRFPDHPIFSGVKPFKIDDGWLYKLRFSTAAETVTPLLRTTSAQAKGQPAALEDVVAWTYERSGQGRSFSFTGTHLHSSFSEEGYRKFLVNGILWASNLDIPKTGAPVSLDSQELPEYLTPAPKKK